MRTRAHENSPRCHRCRGDREHALASKMNASLADMAFYPRGWSAFRVVVFASVTCSSVDDLPVGT